MATNDIEGPGALEQNAPVRNAILIAGPTASGKSALAIDAARRTGGTIVNADSMQVYSGLEILTARPSPADLEAARHRLYGHVDPATAYSTGMWLRDLRDLLSREPDAAQAPIFVGGTGLYFEALTGGLSEMPEIPPAIRDGWRTRLTAEGAAMLHRVLAERDPEVAAVLEPGDGHRIARALEVLEATGRSIRDWRRRRGEPLVDAASARFVVLDVDRAELHRRIDRRFEAMMTAGAIEEAAEFSARGLPADLPAMKAIGVRELAAFVRGTLTRTEAVDRAKAATRQYAKRQSTWFRNRFGPEWRFVQTPVTLAKLDLPLPE